MRKAGHKNSMQIILMVEIFEVESGLMVLNSFTGFYTGSLVGGGGGGGVVSVIVISLHA